MRLVIQFYAMAILGHFIAYPRYLNSNESLLLQILQTLIFPAAFWLLIKPGISILRWVAILQIVSFWEEMPRTGSHWFMIAAASMTFICFDYQKNAKSIIRVLRMIFLIAYFFSFFAKLNYGFFSEKSCALDIFSAIMPAGLSFEANILAKFATVTEATILVMLALAAGIINKHSSLRRTARILILTTGITIAILFHGTLAFATQFHIADFTVTVYFFLAAFLTRSGRNSFHTANENKTDKRLLVMVTPIFIAVFILVTYEFNAIARSLLQFALPGLVTVTAIVLFRKMMLLFNLTHEKESMNTFALQSHESKQSYGTKLATALIVVVMIVNGLSPYIGIKDTFSFTMYSNLQLAQGRENHMLLHQQASLFQDAKPFYTIHDSNDKNILLYKKTGYMLHHDNLAQYLTAHPAKYAIVLENGLPSRIDSQNVGDTNMITRKFRSFRAVDLFQPPRCQLVWLPLD